MSNINFYCEHHNVIPQPPTLLMLAKVVSLTIEIVISVNSDSVDLFNYAMGDFANNSVPIKQVPCSDIWRRM
jgi:hypothetical protein